MMKKSYLVTVNNDGSSGICRREKGWNSEYNIIQYNIIWDSTEKYEKNMREKNMI